MTRSPSEPLTQRQREVLDWVRGFIREHGIPPTVREIGGAFEIRSSSAFDFLQTLERKGHLERGERRARALVLKGRRPRHECGCDEVRVVGRIRAGGPIEAIEHDLGTVAVKKGLFRGGDVFALEVEGESMIEAGILPGDRVIVRKQEIADDGDVVVALIESDATLKRFFREADGVRLEPANRAMSPIHVRSGEFRIQGKVVGVVRLMEHFAGGGREDVEAPVQELQQSHLHSGNR